MFSNYLRIGIRHLIKHKRYSYLNIIGLAVGLCASLLMLLYIQSERRYDRFHALGDRLFRIGISAYREGNKISEGSSFTPPIGPAMKAELAGVENYTRYATPRVAYFSTGNKTLRTEEVLYADSTFLQLFTFPLRSGDARTALASAYSVVLTERLAEKLLGTANALGQTIRLNNGKTLQVTGVVQDPPPDSHLHFQALIAFSTLYDDPANFMDWDGGEQYVTYVLLAPGVQPARIEGQLPDFMWRHINEKYAAFGIRLEPALQALKDIHLHYNPYSAQLRTNIGVFNWMSALILCIACINFINLITARAVRRTKEVGVRKALGARRGGLMQQFLVEIVLQTGLAFVAALGLLALFWPQLPQLLGKFLSVTSVWNRQTLFLMAILFAAVSLLSGAYPALHLARLDAILSLKSRGTGRQRSWLRNGLVVFQFMVSTALVTATLVINKQLHYTQTKGLGFEKENQLVLPLVGEAVQSKSEALKQTLQHAPGVLAVAASSEIPGEGLTTNGYRPEGVEHPLLFHALDVDEGFFDVFQVQLLKGRALSPANPADQKTCLINEALARQLGWKDPIGKKINRSGDREVVGVVRDFHFATLHEAIEPLLLTCTPWNNRFDYLTVRLASGSPAAAVEAVRQAWRQVLPDTPVEYWFLDDALSQAYRSEQRLNKLFFVFSGLSIFIALLGMLGLVVFVAEQRTKEISIRKILGASAGGLTALLAGDFLTLVAWAVCLSVLPAYWFTRYWLAGFVYRIDMPWELFAIAGLLTMGIALGAVSFQSIKTALINPARSLRSE